MTTTQNLDSYIEGDIDTIATRVYAKISTTGYSLLESEVKSLVVDVCRDYIAWGGSLRAFDLNDDDDTLPLILDGSVDIYNDEWSIIKPVVYARCDIMQSKRMEGAQNLGVQPVGISSSEAEQNYREAIALMKQEAFNTHPFSIDTTDDNKKDDSAINGVSSIHIKYQGWFR